MTISSFLRMLIVLVFFHFSYVSLHGQVSATPNQIIKAYQKGHHQSLRDVFLLFQQQPSADLKEIIANGILFDIQDSDFRLMTIDQKLRYYYKHKENIQYYSEWKAFVRNDIPIPNFPYAILDNAASAAEYIVTAREIYNLVQSKSVKKAVSLIENLKLEEAIYSKRILVDILELLKTSDLSCKKKSNLYVALIPHLIVAGEQYTFEQINAISLNQECGLEYYDKMINQIIAANPNEINTDSLASFISKLSQSQFTPYLKTKVYSQTHQISRNYFDEDIDFYGKLLSAIPIGDHSDEDEIINAMISSESPKTLLYLATRWYNYAKENKPRSCDLLNVMNAFIDHGIQVNTPDGQAKSIDCSRKNLDANKSILAYWINNHKHYEWNIDLKKFVNKSILKKDRQQLTQLYKNLNKDNTSLAFKAYWKLIASDAILLAQVDKIYSKKLLNYNSELPSRKYKYLIHLSRLVEYCKSNQIKYKISPEIEFVANQLLTTSSVKDRLDIENTLIDKLNIDNISAFEIWAIVHSGQSEIKYSATRITNIFYNQQIKNIADNDKQLLLFLKKSNLFKLFGDHGASKYYLNKILDTPILSPKRLISLRNGILDEDILASIGYISQYKDRNEQDTEIYTLTEFIKTPLAFDSKIIDKITEYNSKSIQKLISSFNAKQNSLERYRSLNWIENHLPKEAITFLIKLKSQPMTLANADGVLIDCKEYAHSILGKYSQVNLSLSSEYLSNHKSLFESLYQQNLEELKKSERPSASNFNEIILSNFFAPADRQTILSLIPSIKPARNISALKLTQKLSIEELQDLLPQVQSKNALSYLLKITEVDKNDELVAFLINLVKEEGPSESGKFFNTLFKKQWFTEYIDAPQTSLELKQKIQWILTNYWEGDDILSAFEEEQTMLNIIKIELAGKSLEEKIELILNSFVENEIKLHIIEKMIFQVSYTEIPILLDYYDQITEIGGLDLFKFISNDFGIPISDYSDKEKLEQLSLDLTSIDKKSLYHKYLEQIGISLLNENQALDIKKAYSIITEDLVRPFVGTGGSVRDEYVFATIKLLEYEFKRDHGFHPKLNESQSFYKYTSKKRALAWASFLEKELKNEM